MTVMNIITAMAVIDYQFVFYLSNYCDESEWNNLDFLFPDL